MTKPEQAKRKHTREVFLRREFGKDFNYGKMLKSQRGRCANHACRAKLPGGHGVRFHVDHDHRWGWVRGLLCSECNSALGMTNDSPRVLQGLIDYLERTSGTRNLGRHYEQRVRHDFRSRAEREG